MPVELYIGKKIMNNTNRLKIDSDLKKINIPGGYYHAVIKELTEAEYKTIDGTYLRISFEITRGDFKGRNIWEMFQIWHPESELCVEYSIKNLLKLINSATPREKIDYYDELEGKRVGLIVKELYGDEVYDKPYEIVEFLHPKAIRHESV